MKRIYLISSLAIIFALIFSLKPDWFKLFWGVQILLLPLLCGALMALVQNEDRSYRFLPKLVIGSILTSFVFVALMQIIAYSSGGNLYIIDSLYTTLFFFTLFFFGGLCGVVIRGFTLLMRKKNKDSKQRFSRRTIIISSLLILIFFLFVIIYFYKY